MTDVFSLRWDIRLCIVFIVIAFCGCKALDEVRSIGMADLGDYYSRQYVKKGLEWNLSHIIRQRDMDKIQGHAEALAELGDPRAVQILLSLMENKPNVYKCITQSMNRLLGASYGKYISDFEYGSGLNSLEFAWTYDKWITYIGYWTDINKSLMSIELLPYYWEEVPYGRIRVNRQNAHGFVGRVNDPRNRTKPNEPYIQILKDPIPDFSENNTLTWVLPWEVEKIEGWPSLVDVIIHNAAIAPLESVNNKPKVSDTEK